MVENSESVNSGSMGALCCCCGRSSIKTSKDSQGSQEAVINKQEDSPTDLDTLSKNMSAMKAPDASSVVASGSAVASAT